MYELGGVTVTWGVVVLALVLVAGAGWLAWRGPYAVVALGALVGAVHAVAHWTEYLDAAEVASVRELALERGAEAFFAVAAALDRAFAAIRRGIEWALDSLAAVSMPAASVSVLEFGTFLLAVAAVGALVTGALIRIARWETGAPIGEWLAGLGVVFGAAGVLWTWLPVPMGELVALHALLVVGALALGATVAAVVVRIPTPALRRRVRTHR